MKKSKRKCVTYENIGGKGCYSARLVFLSYVPVQTGFNKENVWTVGAFPGVLRPFVSLQSLRRVESLWTTRAPEYGGGILCRGLIAGVANVNVRTLLKMTNPWRNVAGGRSRCHHRNSGCDQILRFWKDVRNCVSIRTISRSDHY
jgi:hypothetical protein